MDDSYKGLNKKAKTAYDLINQSYVWNFIKNNLKKNIIKNPTLKVDVKNHIIKMEDSSKAHLKLNKKLV